MKKELNFSFIIIAVTILFAERSVLSQQVVSSIKTGSKVPEFSLPDQNDKTFDIKTVLGKKNLVIYFYVKDETPGCTTEACTFRDQYEVFKKAEAMIIGISSQSAESHKQFAEKYKLPFTLLSDENNKVHRLFGVNTGEDGSKPGRITFVVDKTGKVVYSFDSMTQPVQHVNEALNILKKLK
jgi:peroxiredoxin Q/BCP